MSRIDELTRKDLVKDVDKSTKDKSRLVRRAVYEGITEDYTVYYRVPSVTSSPPTSYIVKIKLLEYPDIAEDKDLSIREKVRLAISGDLQISCTCPAFLYFGYKYILTQLDSNESNDEHRFPKIRNPKLQGIMCKHCYLAISVFPMTWDTIARDIQSKKFIRGR